MKRWLFLALVVMGCDDEDGGGQADVGAAGMSGAGGGGTGGQPFFGGEGGAPDMAGMGGMGAAGGAGGMGGVAGNGGMAGGGGGEAGNGGEGGLGGEGGEGGMAGGIGGEAGTGGLGGEGGGLEPDSGMAGAGGGDGGQGGEGGFEPGAGIRGDVFLAERLPAGDDPLFATTEGTGIFTNYARLPDERPEAVSGDCARYGMNADAGEGRRFGVGTLAITGGAQDLALEYDPVGEGYSVSADQVFDLWSAGQTLAISAPGSRDLGPFATAVDAPEALTGVLPRAFRRGGTAVAWDAGNGDAIHVILRAGGVVVECMSPDDGGFDVPAAALAWLGNAATLTFELRRVTQETLITEAPQGEVRVHLEHIHVDRGVPLE